MNKKDILELRKHLKKENCTFTKMCGCYVTGEKHSLLKFRESFLNLEEDEYFKFLDIAKKAISGTLGNNLLKLDFEYNEENTNEKQVSLMALKSSALKNDDLLDSFYQSVIDNYSYEGNFLILLFHDAYDVITKTSDNLKLDESESVYEYVLCAICPVTLSKPGLRYFEEDNSIRARLRDWVVEMPAQGFLFPAFIDRGADVNSIIYYTKNAKDTHPEIMENVLGCPSRNTLTVQKETFKEIIEVSLSGDEKEAEEMFMEIQDTLNSKVEEYNSMYEDVKDPEPFTLTKNEFQTILEESGVSKEATLKIEKSYDEIFVDDLPLAENLIDQKILKQNEQRKKEEHLKKQVAHLQTRLEEVKSEVATDSEKIQMTDDESKAEVVLHVKPEKITMIKSEIIDGKKCIIIPVEEDEHTTINGLTDLV